MDKLDKRFGMSELPETALIKFQLAAQEKAESLEEWAERVLTLAVPAFQGLPEDYLMKKAVSQFCQGCLDQGAGKHAALSNPGSINAALEIVKQHCYLTESDEGEAKTDPCQSRVFSHP